MPGQRQKAHVRMRKGLIFGCAKKEEKLVMTGRIVKEYEGLGYLVIHNHTLKHAMKPERVWGK